jgi:hypothetical protein
MQRHRQQTLQDWSQQQDHVLGADHAAVVINHDRQAFPVPAMCAKGKVLSRYPLDTILAPQGQHP